ncbi:hypothetical protein EYF80_025707 [Liparis tanakae]|uniref:Uncharacterized protein n=1 Tax=Liparis tanakae TaxID=230148 RepID=A0A4Z2HE15_9TELE|nr:hypothetical protein EYF80_025707 [Liparis tanakae]
MWAQSSSPSIFPPRGRSSPKRDKRKRGGESEGWSPAETGCLSLVNMSSARPLNSKAGPVAVMETVYV